MAIDKVIICRCENVTLETIRNTVEKYACSSREVKLRTRAAMGYCGGRTCRNIIDRIVSQINDEPIQDEVQLSYRSPVRPITLGTLRGDKHGA